MKQPVALTLMFAAVLLPRASAAEKIEDFLGLKFGANPAIATEAMLARGCKLKDANTPDTLTFSDGTFAAERFDIATVTVKFSTGKSDDKGIALYDTIRKSLTDKYGPPTSAPATARGRNFIEKARASQLETIWQSKDALKGEHRSITLRVPGIGMYDWTFKVIYQDHHASGAKNVRAPRKDI